MFGTQGTGPTREMGNNSVHCLCRRRREPTTVTKNSEHTTEHTFVCFQLLWYKAGQGSRHTGQQQGSRRQQQRSRGNDEEEVNTHNHKATPAARGLSTTATTSKLSNSRRLLLVLASLIMMADGRESPPSSTTTPPPPPSSTPTPRRPDGAFFGESRPAAASRLTPPDVVPLGEPRRTPRSSISSACNLRHAARVKRFERMEAMRVVGLQAREAMRVEALQARAGNAARATAWIARRVTRCEVRRSAV